MLTVDLGTVAIESMRLQNGYAHAVDTRDWDTFRTLFTPEVSARYPHSTFDGMESWLENFIPFHDTCAWTQHVMTNHLVGEDENGIWASCYGWVQWTFTDKPGYINRAAMLYRDRLLSQDGVWRITRRKADQLMGEHDVPIPPGLSLPKSVLDLADMS